MELVDEEVFKGGRGEGGTVCVKETGVDDIALARSVGPFDLEGSSVGADVGLRSVVVLPGCGGDAVLIARVWRRWYTVGRPVGRACFVGEREGGVGDRMVEDDIDLGGKGSPNAKASGAVAGIIEAAHAVVLLRRCVHITLPKAGIDAVWGDNNKRPAEPQPNLMRVPAASKRRLDNLGPTGQRPALPAMLNSEFIIHKRITGHIGSQKRISTDESA